MFFPILARPTLGSVSATKKIDAAGTVTAQGVVPVGATAKCVKNNIVLGDATVSALGVATYGPLTLVGADKVRFNWTLTGSTPDVTVPGSAPIYVPPVDPVAAASSAQASYRSSELTKAAADKGSSGTGTGPFTALARPVISGKPKVGESLIGYPGLWDPTAGLSYIWTVGGVVASETSRRYVVQAADSGKDIIFSVKPNAGTTATSQAMTAFTTLPTLDDDTGTPITTDTGAVLELADRSLQILAPYSPDQNRTNKFADPSHTGITVTISDSDIFVGPTQIPLSFCAPGVQILNIYHSGVLQLSLVPDDDGYVQGILPITNIKNGALWIEVRALVDGKTEDLTTFAICSGFDVIVRGGSTAPLNAIPPAAQTNGLTVIGFSEDFSQALNVSTGTTLPSGGKWFGNQAFDPRGYGDSTFAPPEGPYGTMKVIDKMLRVRSVYNPDAQTALKDGFGRTSGWVSGTICTSFPDATTTVPNMAEGYYECEIRVPKGIGTWPAFWLNDQGGLVLKAKGTPSNYGRETDILEQYNETNGHVCTQHRYLPTAQGGPDMSTGFHVANDLGQEVWAWVRVGCLTLTDRIEYYVNDVKVGTDTKYNPPDRTGPGLEHIILGLAMGGGWPLAVPPSKYYDCYFRNVRQFKKAA
jgi:hypothetical protein